MLLCTPACGKPDTFHRSPLEPKGFEAIKYSGNPGKPSYINEGIEQVKWQKEQLRLKMRDKRHRQPPLEQKAAAYLITQRLSQLPEFQKAQHIALYMSFNGEVPTQFIFQLALKLHKSCYLPAITATHHLLFTQVDNDSHLGKNRYGIFEPTSHSKIMIASQFDLVIVPLVAFDAAMHRLGMGGGYYDRTFALKSRLQRPCLVGLGYEFQRVNQLPHSNLDKSLDLVVTEKRVY